MKLIELQSLINSAAIDHDPLTTEVRLLIEDVPENYLYVFRALFIKDVNTILADHDGSNVIYIRPDLDDGETYGDDDVT